MVGLPDGADPEVTVEGPDGSAYVVTGDEEFDVDPGEYIVSAGAVSAAGSTYYTDFDVEAITVEAHQTTSFEVDYRVEIPDHTSIVDASLGDDAPRVVGGELVLPRDVAPADLDTSEYVIATGANTDTGVVVKRIEAVDWGTDAVVVTGEDVPLYEAMPKGVIKFGDDVIEPTSHVVPASYDRSGPFVVPAKQTGDGPVFEIGFGGYQAGVTSKGAYEKSPDVKKVKGCAFEIPPTKFSLDDFAVIAEGGEIGWGGDERPTSIRLTIRGAYTVATEAPVEAKCALEAHLEDIHIDKLCKVLGASKIVRAGPIHLTCEVSAAVKANIHLTSDGKKIERSGNFTYGVVATRDSDGNVDGRTISETLEEVKTDVASTETKYSVELAAELAIGGELTWLIGVAIGVEQALAVEETEKEFKVPFKGKIFLKYGIGAGDTEIGQEVQLFHWSTNLYLLSKTAGDDETQQSPNVEDVPSPEESPAGVPRIEIPYEKRADLDTVRAAAKSLAEREGEEVYVAIEANADDPSFVYFLGQPWGPEYGTRDHVTFMLPHNTCQEDDLGYCLTLTMIFPEDFVYDSIFPEEFLGVESPTSLPRVSLNGHFTVTSASVDRTVDPHPSGDFRELESIDIYLDYA